MSAKIERREFITLLGGAAAWPLAGGTQHLASSSPLWTVRRRYNGSALSWSKNWIQHYYTI